MRVSGWGGGGGHGRDSGSGRAERFRRGRRVGDRVEGTLLRRMDDELAWVLVDGEELLARVGAGVEPGARLAFEIMRLAPEIVLRVIEGGGGATHGPATTAHAVAVFRTAMQQFDARLSEIWDDVWQEQGGKADQGESSADAPLNWPDRATRRRLFLRGVARKPEHAALFANLCARRAEVDDRLRAEDKGRFYYVPWMLPGAGGQELAVRTRLSGDGRTLHEISFGARLAVTGPVLLRLMRLEGNAETEDAAFRVFTQDRARAEHVGAVMRALAGELAGGRVRCLGVDVAPRGVPGVLDQVARGGAQGYGPGFRGVNRHI